MKLSLPANDQTIIDLFLIYHSHIVLEKAVSCRLNVHLNCNHPSEVFQSQYAYKQFHTIETALPKVNNDIALNMDTAREGHSTNTFRIYLQLLTPLIILFI